MNLLSAISLFLSHAQPYLPQLLRHYIGGSCYGTLHTEYQSCNSELATKKVVIPTVYSKRVGATASIQISYQMELQIK